MPKHFLKLLDYDSAQLGDLLDLADELKEKYLSGGSENCMAGKTAVLLFEKPSSRTRISFQVAAAQLGGSSIYVRPEDIGGLGKREPISDLTRVLNGYVNVIIARTFEHAAVLELAKYAIVPVINALTDIAHPCQAMGDMLTIREQFGSLEGRKLTFVGDGNNVARSLAVACLRFGMKFALASPAKYAFGAEFLERIRREPDSDKLLSFGTDPYQAVEDANIVYADTWTSMGQEQDKQQRTRDFADYQVDRRLLAAAGKGACVMHCLPAYRGLEITDDLLESDRSIVFKQAENRLHFQRALIKYMLSQ